MKNILIITLEYPPVIGGIATYVHELALALPGARVCVLAPAHPEAGRHDAAVPYRVYRKKLLFPFLWPRWLRLVWHAWRIAKKEQSEIVLIHHVLPAGYAAWALKKILGTPFIVFFHGTDFIVNTRTRWKAKMVDAVTKAAETLVFNSESLKQRLTGVFPHLASKSVAVYPCPSAVFFSPPAPATLARLRALYALDGKKVMLSVSRLGDGKGFPYLVRLLPDLLARVPNLVWLVVGDGPKLPYLLKEVQQRSLQNIVRFVGSVPHRELAPYYYLADLFVLLTHPDVTRGEEGLGLVFLEAAAAGRAVVAGRSGGVEEAVMHGKTGFVVDVGASREVTETIVRLMNDAPYAAQLGAAGRARVEAEFQWKHQVERLRPRLDDVSGTADPSGLNDKKAQYSK